jgi:hypothetical protein
MAVWSLGFGHGKSFLCNREKKDPARLRILGLTFSGLLAVDFVIVNGCWDDAVWGLERGKAAQGAAKMQVPQGFPREDEE